LQTLQFDLEIGASRLAAAHAEAETLVTSLLRSDSTGSVGDAIDASERVHAEQLELQRVDPATYDEKQLRGALVKVVFCSRLVEAAATATDQSCHHVADVLSVLDDCSAAVADVDIRRSASRDWIKRVADAATALSMKLPPAASVRSWRGVIGSAAVALRSVVADVDSDSPNVRGVLPFRLRHTVPYYNALGEITLRASSPASVPLHCLCRIGVVTAGSLESTKLPRPCVKSGSWTLSAMRTPYGELSCASVF
jgi:hypothetical protein